MQHKISWQNRLTLAANFGRTRVPMQVIVRDLINQTKTSADPNYCQRVTANNGAPGEQHLREFQDNEKTIPTILTTSQKLSTGVDARNIRNIVLMRPINSMIEFKQIIGRGTRLYDGKDHFTIYDFVRRTVTLAIQNGRRAAGTGTVREVWLLPLPVCEDTATTMFLLRETSVRVSERVLRDMRAAPMCLQKKSQDELGGRKSAHYSAHGLHNVLASGRHADVRSPIHGDVVWQTAGVLQRRG